MFLWRWAATHSSWAPPWLAPAAAAAVARPLLAPAAEQERVSWLQAQLIKYLQSLSEASSRPSSRAAANPAASPRLPCLAVAPSSIPGAGRGVFLDAAGPLPPAGAILTLYPGLVYDMEAIHAARAASIPGDDEAFAPSPPAFMLGNNYLLHLRCLGRSFLVDGRPGGLSAQRFAAAAAASSAAGTPVNSAWLLAAAVPDARAGTSAVTLAGSRGSRHGQHPQQQQQQTLGRQEQAGGQPQPLLAQSALGHLINHQPGSLANATFDLCPLPATLPPPLLRFVPALNAGGTDPGLRWVPLVRAADGLSALNLGGLPAGGVSHAHAAPGSSTNGSGASSSGSRLVELFVDYGANPLTLGYHP